MGRVTSRFAIALLAAGLLPSPRGAVAQVQQPMGAGRVLPGLSADHEGPGTKRRGRSPGSEDGVGDTTDASLDIFLITIGPGRQVWERFGHNAIWVRDTARGVDRAYNYGMFSFEDPGFLGRFVRGEMDYWMAGFDTESMLRAYVAADRSIWVQELDLTPQQKTSLYEFLQRNERPENRFYRYDYYRDNCSTRVRDAIDRVLGGQLREESERIQTGTTYRSHFRRLMAPDPLIYAGGSFAIGPATDRPISAWEEMFLPVRMMKHLRGISVADGQGGERPLVRREFTTYVSTLEPESQAPPDWRLPFLAIGLTIAVAMVLLGHLGSRSRGARVLAALSASTWALLLGIGGLFMLGIWFLTAHWAGYRNENLFFLNPLALGLAFVIPFGAAGRPVGRAWTRGLSAFIAAWAVLGLVVQPLPWFPQVNAEIIAAALPPTLAMTWLAFRLTGGAQPASTSTEGRTVRLRAPLTEADGKT